MACQKGGLLRSHPDEFGRYLGGNRRALTLSENGLYTVEAWKIFLQRLSPKGVFTVSRWYDPTVPDETGRLVSLAMATLFEMGVSEPRRHVFLAAQREVATLVLSKTPLAPSDVEALEKAAAEYQHDVLITPRSVPGSFTLLRIMSAADRKALNAFTSSLEFDLTPPTDDRAFFFQPIGALPAAAGSGVRSNRLSAGNLPAAAYEEQTWWRPAHCCKRNQQGRLEKRQNLNS